MMKLLCPKEKQWRVGAGGQVRPLVYRILKAGWIGHNDYLICNRGAGSREDDFDIFHLGTWLEKFVLTVATTVCGDVWR